MKPAVICPILILALGFAAWSQSRPATVLDGVYTEQQAEAGREHYEAICATCHDGDEPEAPAPKGPEFIERWRDAPLSFLYNFIHTNMPGDKPGSLPETKYVDVVAYLLHTGGYPSGSTELTAAKARDILLVGPDGPKPLPVNALVSAVGCLSGSGDSWTLTSGTYPLRVRVGDETAPEELSVSRGAALGSATYTLKNAGDFPRGEDGGTQSAGEGCADEGRDSLRAEHSIAGIRG